MRLFFCLNQDLQTRNMQTRNTLRLRYGTIGRTIEAMFCNYSSMSLEARHCRSPVRYQR